MIINVTTGQGTGPTKLAAFDAALNHAGVANFNLIFLSSIIPAGTSIRASHKTLDKIPGEWGDRLYVVMAEMRVDTPNIEAWAGIGWVQDKKTGKGLFVEHEGNSEKTVREDIKQSLKALVTTRGMDFGEMQMKVVGRICKKEPVCALAVAVYQTSTWKDAIK